MTYPPPPSDPWQQNQPEGAAGPGQHQPGGSQPDQGGQYPAGSYQQAGQYPSGPYPPPGQYSPGPYSQPGQFSMPPMSPVGAGAPFGARPSRDGISITAFILGIIAIVPLALIFGIVGLFRTKGGRRRGRWMAVTGIVLALLWVAGITALVAAVNSGKPQRAADGTVTMLQQSLQRCSTVAMTYLGGASTRLQVVAFYPSSTRWSLGTYASHCVLYDRSKSITGEIRSDR